MQQNRQLGVAFLGGTAMTGLTTWALWLMNLPPPIIMVIGLTVFGCIGIVILLVCTKHQKKAQVSAAGLQREAQPVDRWQEKETEQRDNPRKWLDAVFSRIRWHLGEHNGDITVTLFFVSRLLWDMEIDRISGQGIIILKDTTIYTIEISDFPNAPHQLFGLQRSGHFSQSIRLPSDAPTKLSGEKPSVKLTLDVHRKGGSLIHFDPSDDDPYRLFILGDSKEIGKGY